MIKSWDSYYVVFLSGILSLGIPLSLGLISFIFFPKRKKTQPTDSFSPTAPLLNRAKPYQSINVRFFLAANAALVLIALALELVPCVATLQSGGKETLLRGLISVISLASFSALGLIYATKKGNMNWLPSSHIKSSEPDLELSEDLLKETAGE